MNKKILIILKISFQILSTILDLMLVLVSLKYLGNLSWYYKQVIYFIPKSRSLLNHKNSFYSIKHPRFFSLTFPLFAWFTVTFILRLLVNSKVPKFYLKNLKMFCTLIFLDINTRFPIIYKKLYKNGIKCLMTGDFDVLNVSGIKYRVRCR